MPTQVKVALIVCATIVTVAIVCCSGLIVLGSVTPPPAPVTTPMPYPWSSK
jgi:hypothetical protein